MKEQGDGLIINISSWAGKHVGIVTGPAYTAAKHAMNAMNESLNMENCRLGSEHAPFAREGGHTNSR